MSTQGVPTVALRGTHRVLTGALTGAIAGLRTHTGAQGRRVRAQVAVQSAMLLALAGLRGDVGFAPAVLDEFMPPLLIVASDSSSVRPSARLRRRPGSVGPAPSARPGEDRRVHVGSLDYPEYTISLPAQRNATQRVTFTAAAHRRTCGGACAYSCTASRAWRQSVGGAHRIRSQTLMP